METFSHLFKALEAGCPPHAGLAIGFDRLVAVMQGRDSVRDVIAFPKNPNGEDPMVQSPGPISLSQLEDYHLSIVDPPSLKQKIVLKHLQEVLSNSEADLQLEDDIDSAETTAVMIGGAGCGAKGNFRGF